MVVLPPEFGVKEGSFPRLLGGDPGSEALGVHWAPGQGGPVRHSQHWSKAASTKLFRKITHSRRQEELARVMLNIPKLHPKR